MSLIVYEKKEKEEMVSLLQEKYGKSLRVSDEELFLILGFVKEKGLSIFGNDFYLITYGNKNQIIVSIEGIRKMAQKIGNYGLKFKYFNKEGIFDFPCEEIVGIRAILKTSDDLEKERDVFLSEFTTGKNLWAQKPIAMLLKVAEATILRASFNLGSAYIKEEFDSSMINIEKEEEKPVIKPLPERQENLSKRKEITTMINRECARLSFDKQDATNFWNYLELKEKNEENMLVFLDALKKKKTPENELEIAEEEVLRRREEEEEMREEEGLEVPF